MISFREMLDAVDRLAEILKGTAADEATFHRSAENLNDLRAILESPRVRQLKSAGEVADYLARVAIPQLAGIHDSLVVASQSHFNHMRLAHELAGRLEERLHALSDGTVDGFLG
jgi:hypothetical protein